MGKFVVEQHSSRSDEHPLTKHALISDVGASRILQRRPRTTRWPMCASAPMEHSRADFSVFSNVAGPPCDASVFEVNALTGQLGDLP